LVIARFGDELLLLITGLESKDKTDFRGRAIRHSVAWVGEDSKENEQKLRAIAACALRDNLRDDIDKAIQFSDGEYGFDLKDSIDKLQINEVRTSYANTESKLGTNTPKLKEDLANELEEYCLPKRVGTLVVVTGIKSENVLQQRGIWRGLSSLVKEQEWKNGGSFTPPETAQPEQTNDFIALIIKLIVLSTGSIVLIAFFLFMLSQPKPNPQPETQNPSQSKSSLVITVESSSQTKPLLGQDTNTIKFNLP
jgi:hypothetical protein